MITKERDGLKWLEFELFQPFKELKHGILTHQNTEDSSSDASLNLNTQDEKKSELVQKNLEKVKETFYLADLVYANQMHGDKIEAITSENQQSFFECDGLITTAPDIALLIKHADCQAALFYDPIQKVIANIHCGWRGNVLNIYKTTVAHLCQNYGCYPKNIYVGISPSLGPNHAQFKNYQKELPKDFWKYQVQPSYFDLWEIAKQQLLETGILPSHLEIAKICTYENKELFFSYRRGKDEGRNGTFIHLNP